MKSLIPSSLLLRSISSRKLFKSRLHNQTSPFSSSFSSCEEIAVANEVINIIETSNPMESVLEEVLPILTPEIVASVLEEKKHNPGLGFRFFIWAAKRKCFRSWVSHNLIIDMLISGDSHGGNGYHGFDLYWKTLDEVRKCGNPITSEAFAVLISAYWRLKKAEKAVDTFGRMKEFDCKPALFTYNMILHVLVKKNVILLAMAVYNMMLKSNISLNSSTFTILIDGLCKSRKTQDALKLFDEMSERGILPSKITFTVILSGLCQVKRTDEAYRLFTSMKSRGCKPDYVVYNVLLNGFCKQGMMTDALTLLESFKKDGYVIGKKGYASIIEGLIIDHKIDEAHALFQQLFQMHIIPDVVLYTIMMRGLSQAGRVKDALNLLNDMTQRGVVPDTFCYNTLIKGFCDIGLLDEARSLQIEISASDLFPDACTYSILICGMCKNGLIGEAQHIFNEMEKQGCLPSVITFNSLIEGLCKAGKLEEAHLMFYKMEIGRNPSLFLRLSQGADRVLDNASLQAMVEKLCESGMILRAYNLLMQLADSGVLPDIVTYNILINGLCKAGNINAAFKLFQELQLKGHSPDKITYGTLIDGFYRAGRDDDALKLFEQIRNSHSSMLSPEIYKSLMTWSCRKGKTSSAFNIWLQYMKDIGGEGDEEIELVQKHFEAGNVEMAIRGLLEINFKWKSFDSAPYNIWLIGLVQARRTEDALRIFSVLEELHVNVSGPSCVMLLDQLCYEGNLDQAVKLFLYTMEKGLRLMPRICNKLLRYLISRDKAKDAVYLLTEMKSFGYDIDAYLYGHTKFLVNHYRIIREIE
ncbi:hypothetical protein M9H77_04093 [Catharanthus roseus]|uniref:Uncharacterized protein n=1 Tax=Catharanthus roseus TaxID=4058 RepID=A0ACC0CD57_CATRO|nr:hypothetical protein M9H77_04093 [Catharanthus roseus]